MAGEEATVQAAPIDVVLCADRDAYGRLASIIRHLSVGLVDLSAMVRILTSAPDSEDLSLGPLQTLIYQEPKWLLHKWRLRQIAELVDERPPTVVHVVSGGAIEIGRMLAEQFDADWLFHLTSFEDVDALAMLDTGKIGHFICGSDRIMERAIPHVQRAAGERGPHISLVRPGLLAGAKPVCFAEPDRVPTLLCTSRMEPGVGVELLVSATAQLVRRGHELMVFMLGAGSGETALRKMVHELGLTTRVTFSRPIADPFAVMNGADIYVQPEVERGLWAKPLQAMATGLAMVTFEGCASDAYRDGQTAAVCRDRTVDGLTACIERLLTQRDYARQLAKGGQDHIRQNHSLSAMAEQTMAIYRQLVVRRSTFALNR